MQKLKTKKINKILSIGNPNSGKTTIFNALTSSNQKTGNWSGVTVDKKVGKYHYKDFDYEVTDLPGIHHLGYSQEKDSLDEIIATKAIDTLESDLIINIIDVSSLERGLYLSLQLLESNKPVVIILNKIDLLDKVKQKIAISSLEDALGCPVIPVSAYDNKSIVLIKDTLSDILSSSKNRKPLKIDYSDSVENVISSIKKGISLKGNKLERADILRYLESGSLDLLPKDEINKLESNKINLYNDIDIDIADAKYTFIHRLLEDTLSKKENFGKKFSNNLDKVFLNTYLSLPIFLLFMYLMFVFTVNIGGSFIDFFDILADTIFVSGTHYLLDERLPEWTVTFIADGIGGGIQTVLTFIPIIGFLFLFLAVLESSGYMSRVAFILDKIMQKVGLPGKAFIPLILGFGCSIPSVLATRNLNIQRERKLTAAMIPFMSCGARLPVYALFGVAFFPNNAQNVVFILYLLGIFVAFFTGLILRKSLYPGESEHLVIEIPDYEVPRIKNILLNTGRKLKYFIFGAGKTIVIVVALISLLNSFSLNGKVVEDRNESLLSEVSKIITPVLYPMGIDKDNWQATVSLVTGLLAKEVLVGTLNTLYVGDDEGGAYSFKNGVKSAFYSIPENLFGINYKDPLGIKVNINKDDVLDAEEQGVNPAIFENLRNNFKNKSVAMSFLIFVLLYTPCAAAIGAYKREFGTRFTLFISTWTLFLAYGLAVVYYQMSFLFITPFVSLAYMALFILSLFIWFILLKKQSNKVEKDLASIKII